MTNYHKRAIESKLSRHLRTMPVVVITGARQTGKSTLVQSSEIKKRRYWTLDDFDTLATLSESPDRLLSTDQDLTLGEVQRLPKLLVDIKRLVDQNRRRGRFLLTGSANLLLKRDVSESLAGRASYLTLWPMSTRERLGTGSCGIWDEFISNAERDWLDLVSDQHKDELLQDKVGDWRETIARGGYPVPALELTDEEERGSWFEAYIRTFMERDVPQLANVSNLIDFHRLTRLACHRIGQVVNQSELGRTAGIPQATVNRYLNLLEASYQLVRVPAYTEQRARRLIKGPKLYWSDPGLSLHLSGGEAIDAHFQNLVLCDLLIWRDSNLFKNEVFHWRTTHGVEVDFVLETRFGLIPIEVKATQHPRLRDTTNLNLFLDEYKDVTRSGILIHAGVETMWLTNEVLAVPWWRIL